MISNIPIGAKVFCSDGTKGTLTAVVVDPSTRSLTHIAVVEKSMLHGEERIVPVDRIAKTTRDTVELNCTGEELLQMEPFTRTHYLETDQGGEGYAYSMPYTTMYSYSTDMMVPTPAVITDVIVPEGEVAINRGMPVEATDGPVGQVGELLIDPQSGQVTHFLLMKGHGWGKKEIAIQVSSIANLEEGTIHLKIDKNQIEQLPSLPLKRNWDEVFATELELMVWIYEGKEKAQQALEKVQALSSQYAMEVLSSTVIEKDKKGKIKVREEKKVRSKGRIALGIALGGLAGLVVGPVALVAGAVAGGAAGKKSANKVEVGFSEAKLKKLDETLVPGGSALVLLIEHRWFNTLQVEMAESGGQLIYERLADVNFDDLVEQVQKS